MPAGPAILFDSWNAAAVNLKLIQRLNLRFFTTPKAYHTA